MLYRNGPTAFHRRGQKPSESPVCSTWSPPFGMKPYATWRRREGPPRAQGAAILSLPRCSSPKARRSESSANADQVPEREPPCQRSVRWRALRS